MKENSGICVIGIGPGNKEGMSFQAYDALLEADAVVGYKAYVDLVREFIAGKDVYEQGMGGEIDRCQKALEWALAGRKVALICSGDAGVYGMASLMMEIAEPHSELEIEVVPGISAALSGAALLGAPLSHDFAVISLSDYLVDWDTIVKRLRACAEADFCLALYNPRSKARPDYLQKAVEVLLAHKSPETVCGFARQIGREGEEVGYMSLAELKDFEADMFTTVFVGNSETRMINGKMLTPRGYKLG